MQLSKTDTPYLKSVVLAGSFPIAASVLTSSIVMTFLKKFSVFDVVFTLKRRGSLIKLLKCSIFFLSLYIYEYCNSIMWRRRYSVENVLS